MQCVWGFPFFFLYQEFQRELLAAAHSMWREYESHTLTRVTSSRELCAAHFLYLIHINFILICLSIYKLISSCKMIVVKWESERDEGEQNVNIVCCCTWNEQMNTQISSRMNTFSSSSWTSTTINTHCIRLYGIITNTNFCEYAKESERQNVCKRLKLSVQCYY